MHRDVSNGQLSDWAATSWPSEGEIGCEGLSAKIRRDSHFIEPRARTRAIEFGVNRKLDSTLIIEPRVSTVARRTEA